MSASTPSFAESAAVAAPARAAAWSARRVTIAAALLGAAGLLSLLESLLPPVALVPWLRLGLANAAVVLAFLVAGPGVALGVSAGRVIVSGLIGGTLAGPGFAMSAAGAAASWLVMWALSRKPAFTAVGWSAAGAAAHMAAQFAVASVLLASPWLFALLPLSALVALAFGALVGHLALIVSSRLPGNW